MNKDTVIPFYVLFTKGLTLNKETQELMSILQLPSKQDLYKELYVRGFSKQVLEAFNFSASVDEGIRKAHLVYMQEFFGCSLKIGE